MSTVNLAHLWNRAMGRARPGDVRPAAGERFPTIWDKLTAPRTAAESRARQRRTRRLPRFYL